MVHPTFGAMRQLPKDLFHLSSVWPLDHGFPRLHLSSLSPHFTPQRARITRASGVFRFLPSPLHYTTVRTYETATCV